MTEVEWEDGKNFWRRTRRQSQSFVRNILKLVLHELRARDTWRRESDGNSLSCWSRSEFPDEVDNERRCWWKNTYQREELGKKKGSRERQEKVSDLTWLLLLMFDWCFCMKRVAVVVGVESVGTRIFLFSSLDINQGVDWSQDWVVPDSDCNPAVDLSDCLSCPDDQSVVDQTRKSISSNAEDVAQNQHNLSRWNHSVQLLFPCLQYLQHLKQPATKQYEQQEEH